MCTLHDDSRHLDAVSWPSIIGNGQSTVSSLYLAGAEADCAGGFHVVSSTAVELWPKNGTTA